jgi:hypothetical protein
MKDTLVCPQVNHWKKKIEENESVEAHPFSWDQTTTWWRFFYSSLFQFTTCYEFILLSELLNFMYKFMYTTRRWESYNSPFTHWIKLRRTYIHSTFFTTNK